MRLNVISDIHINPDYDDELDWNIFEPERLEPADYLIIAGDLGVNETYEEVAAEIRHVTRGKFKDVLWIKGNHDYYYFGRGFKDADTGENVRFDVVDGDFAIVGTTLWVPMKGEWNQYMSEKEMNDYRAIPKWSTKKCRERFLEDREWLRGKLEEYRKAGKKVVIVTHHNPVIGLRPASRDPDRIGSDAAYYVNDGSCDDIKPDLWICGHVHFPIDKTVDGVRYVRNPIGYHGSWYGPGSQISEEHWYDRVVEV